MKTIYLSEHNRAYTLKESCNTRWNNAAICKAHARLDLKELNSRGNNLYIKRYLEVLDSNINLMANNNDGATCCWGGMGYESRLEFSNLSDAVKYLKQYFIIVACDGNITATQSWIDRL